MNWFDQVAVAHYQIARSRWTNWKRDTETHIQ